MTAEIGVMNRLGVALAADSAVTIGGEARKVYSSADKLFQLSTVAPVGVMVYGSANFLNRPWETIVKSVRRELASTTFATLQEYADFFIGYLRRGEPVFREAEEKEAARRLATMVLLHIREDIEHALDDEAEKRDGLDDDEVLAIASETIIDRHKTITERAYLRDFGEADTAGAATVCAEVAPDLIKKLFDQLPLSPEAQGKLGELLPAMLVRHYVGPAVSGLVFAGFGEEEYEPSILRYEIEERCLGRPRIPESTRHSLGNGGALIVPFAQDDAVAAFLEGIEPSLQEEMHTSVKVLFDGALDVLLARIRSTNAALATDIELSLKPGMDEMLARLYSGWEKMRRQLWSPVLAMVSALPKDELAAVAEALVALTKFRRRVTPVQESVGGPIDVALITKGDGFVWIKRKHYFPSELNPRAMQRLNH